MLGDASQERTRERGSERVDRTLVEAARSGDEEAFASIARGSADRLFAVAHRILRDVGRAEDAVQQTLVTAWRELPGLREVERFDAWIHRILVHACYAEARRARRWSANVRVLSIDGPATPRHDPRTSSTRDALDRGFRRLPPEQRAVFVLHHYLGLPLGEIAEHARRPARHGQIEAPLRNSAASGRPSRPTPGRRPQPRGSGWHERQRLRPDRPALARGRADRMSDRALQAALDEVHLTRQRRARWPAWRIFDMNSTIRLAIGAAVVLVVAVIGLNFVPTGSRGGRRPGRIPTPTPTPIALPVGRDRSRADRAG